MAIEDPVRKKGQELHSLAQELSEHLSGDSESDWLEDKVHGTVNKLRQALTSIENELDIAPDAASPDASEGETPEASEAPGEAAATARPQGPESLSQGALGHGAGDLDMADAAGQATRYAGVPRLPSGALTPQVAVGPPGLEERIAEERRRIAKARQRKAEGSGPPPDDDDGDDSPSGGGSPDATSLDTFFSQVGSSLVSAQRQLDQRSHEYIAELSKAGVGRDMATLYRIPKVTAELKFALEKVDKEGINLLIHSQGSEASTLNQQSVQFEIAAVPAPPETLDAVRQLAPRMDFVLDPSVRRGILKVLHPGDDDSSDAAGDAPPQGAQGEARRRRARADGDRVLMVAVTDSVYLLAHVETAPDWSLGLWQVDVAATTWRSVDLSDSQGAPPKDDQVLWRWLVGLADGQATLLAGT